jgi:hypothetical protein
VTGAADNDARHAFSLDTCNGCHGRETQTQFVHVGGAPGVGVGGEAPLSDFLTGITVVDPVDSTRSRHFGDLARRASVLDNLSSSSCLVDVRPPPLVDRRFHFPIPPVDVRPTLSAH